MPTALKYYCPTCGVRNYIFRTLIHCFTIVFPRARRRILLISSMMPIVFGDSASETHNRQLINVSLSLSHSEEAMLLPILLYQLIYSADQIKNIQELVESRSLTKNHECVEVASAIYKEIPSWILYREPADVVADITTLLTLRHVLADKQTSE